MCSPEWFYHGWSQRDIFQSIFRGSRQLRPILGGDLQRQGDHGLECQLYGAEEPQDHAGQVQPHMRYSEIRIIKKS